MNKLNPATKINRRNAVAQEHIQKPKHRNNKANEKVKNDQVSLSQTSKIKASANNNSKIASDVRYDLINKYRDVLNNGSYVVKAEELADKIVQKIREDKNRLVI